MTRKPTRQVKRFKMTRREWLQALQVAGVAGAGVGLGVLGAEDAAASQATGVCRLCVMRCELSAQVVADRLVRVDGKPGSNHGGFACMHALALPQIVHAKERLRRPLVKRGESFQEVTWDEALRFVAARMQQIKSTYGARAVGVQTGWPFVRHRLVGVLQRFCQAFGTPNLATVASLCEASGRMGKALTCGSKYWADVNNARTLVVWGGNPPISAPPYRQLVTSMATRGRNLVVIDPIRTELADRAQLFLQPRPGSDAALALGMMRVLVDEGLYDADFVRDFTLGFDDLRHHLTEYDTARVEEITSVPADKIRAAARLMAERTPTCVWDGLGLEHHENGVQAMRAVACLQALCGQLDGKGNSVLYTRADKDFWERPLPALYRLHTPEPVPPPAPDKPIGHDDHPLYTVFNRQAQATRFADAILDDRPYPLRGLILVGSNALYTAAGGRRLRQAVQKLDLLVSIDPVLCRSAEFADVVLPATTFAEPGMVPRQHEARTEYEIVAGLAAKLGLARYFPWPDIDTMMRAKSSRYMRNPEVELTPDASYAPERGAAPRFPSPSGKVEFFSSTMQRYGYDPLPTWHPPTERLSQEFPFRLVTGPRTAPYINSQFRHITSLRQKLPEPVAVVHPETARTAGAANGERVVIRSPHGSIEIKLTLSDRVHPEIVVLPAGWSDPAINDLIDDRLRDPVSGFPAFRSGVCAIERVGD